MPERRSPRRLRDVSHLFLSGSQEAHRASPRSTVCAWLVTVGGSLNRAHLAAGTAAAFARLGMCVSLLEVCRSLPNIGYYFGMEPAAYMAPVLRPRELMGGTWNGAVRYCFSADPGAFGRYRGDELPPVVPHVIIAAVSCPRERDEVRFFADVRGAAAAVSDEGSAVAGSPDAVIAAGCRDAEPRVRELTARMRDSFPQASIVLVTDDSGVSREGEADDRYLLPIDIRASWARRVPPADTIFSELAGGLLQVVSQRRKRATGHAANG
jgi:hypothetical protein